MNDFNFDFKNNKKYKSDLIRFLKNQSNVEIGGTRLYDGTGTHYMQNPYEIAELIFFLKSYEKKRGLKRNECINEPTTRRKTMPCMSQATNRTYL